MSASFCDTNVLLYLISADADKAAVAEDVLREKPVVSVQVLNEFANVSRRKSNRSWQEVAEIVARLAAALEVRSLELQTHRLGMELVSRYKFSVYDAMIVAAALEAGCSTLWSEDMQHGQQIAGRLTIRNPFA